MIKKSKKVPLRQTPNFWSAARSFSVEGARVFYLPNKCGYNRFSVVVGGTTNSTNRHSIKREAYLLAESNISKLNSHHIRSPHFCDVVVNLDARRVHRPLEKNKVATTITRAFATIRQSFDPNKHAL